MQTDLHNSKESAGENRSRVQQGPLPLTFDLSRLDFFFTAELLVEFPCLVREEFPFVSCRLPERLRTRTPTSGEDPGFGSGGGHLKTKSFTFGADKPPILTRTGLCQRQSRAAMIQAIHPHLYLDTFFPRQPCPMCMSHMTVSLTHLCPS